MLNTKEICWLAGLLEGEGAFMFRQDVSLLISVTTTDEDVMRHAHALLKGYMSNAFYSKQPNRKPSWTVRVTGSKAAGWMMTIYPFMGQRRRAKIIEVLNKWKLVPRKGWALDGYGWVKHRAKFGCRCNPYTGSCQKNP